MPGRWVNNRQTNTITVIKTNGDGTKNLSGRGLYP